MRRQTQPIDSSAKSASDANMSCQAQTIVCEIRPLARYEIPLLDAHLDARRLAGRHAERYERQREGALAYLIAWRDGLPVGHALARWTGAMDEFVSARIADCAHIEDLFVVPELRSCGAGSQILAHAERLALERGFGRIGLAVGIDNPRARALYERRGYADAGFGIFEIGGTYRDAGGVERRWREVCEYLVKGLGVR